MPLSGHATRRAALFVVIVLIALGTLWPTPTAPPPGEVYCIVCGPLGGVDFVANVVMFVPLGAALIANGRKTGTATVIGALFSLSIEALQWRLIPGRDTSAGDVLANTLGTWSGAVVMWHRVTLVKPKQGTARFLALGWGLITGAIALGAAWALSPSPPDLRYWSQWTPVRGGYVPFTGSLRALSLFGRPLPVGTMIDPTEWPRAYAEGRLEISATLLPAAPTKGPALIARAANPLGEQFQLAQRGSDLVVRGRTRAARAGFRSPVFVLIGGLPAIDTTPRDIAVDIRPGHVELNSSGVYDTLTVSHDVTLGMAWQTLLPFEVTDLRLGRFAAAAWLTAIFLPLGYWGASFRAPAALALTAAAALAVLVVAPRVHGIVAGGFWELTGVALGVLLGVLLGRRVSAATTSDGVAHR
ncbi:MAG: VanZ family protein [Gemmatimonadaceae bacterium]